MPPSCALLVGFAIGARVALLWQHDARTRNVSEYMLVLVLCLVRSVDACVDTWQIKLCDPPLTHVVRERFVVSQTQYKRHVYFISSPVSVLYFDSTFARRAFSVAGPLVWNSLPDYLRDPAVSRDTFCKHLKTFLFAVY